MLAGSRTLQPRAVSGGTTHSLQPLLWPDTVLRNRVRRSQHEQSRHDDVSVIQDSQDHRLRVVSRRLSGDFSGLGCKFAAFLRVQPTAETGALATDCRAVRRRRRNGWRSWDLDGCDFLQPLQPARDRFHAATERRTGQKYVGFSFSRGPRVLRGDARRKNLSGRARPPNQSAAPAAGRI